MMLLQKGWYSFYPASQGRDSQEGQQGLETGTAEEGTCSER